MTGYNAPKMAIVMLAGGVRQSALVLTSLKVFTVKKYYLMDQCVRTGNEESLAGQRGSREKWR